MTLGLLSMDLLWRNALGAVPLAFAVAAICRFARCRASTRHALWLMVLLSLLAPPLLPALNFADDLSALSTQQSVSKARPPIPAPVGRTTPENTPPPASLRGEARSNGTLAPPAILNSTSVAPPAPAAGSTAVIEIPPTSFPRAPRVTAPIPAVPSTQLPASSAPLTASDRSPTPLRSSASHPDSSAHRSIATSPTVEADRAASNASPDTAIVSQAPPNGLGRMWSTLGGLSESIGWRDWLMRVAAARDAIVRLAPIPTSLWLGGCIVLASVMLIRIVRFRRVLRTSWPAPVDVLDVVGDCAASIGLTRLPTVRMTDARVSPLVWCGVRRTLVLPASLWDELEDTGRRAVLLHELAHLRRRDHWICWIEMFACTIYWWNPVAWWVRHRLRDEADYCCDAWVTAVLPTGGARTAYARALLTTRQYLNTSRLNAPSLALGATPPRTARTKRFARRLTMVMTERTTPRLSVYGSTLALLLAAATWLATPLWACPPEEQTGPSHAPAAMAAKAEKAAAEKAAKAAQEVRVRVPHVVVTTPEAHAVAPRGAGSTFEQHMADRSDDHAPRVAQAAPSMRAAAGGGGLEERIGRLEERMDRLTAHLEQLLGGGGADGRMQPSLPRNAAPPAPPTPPAPPAPSGRGGGMRAPTAHAGPSGQAPLAGVRGGGRGGMAPPTARSQDSGEVIIRFYSLPADKAEALFEFMRRDDVPVLVAPAEDGIEVHGTARQHELFGAFIRLINPDGGQPEAMAPESDAKRDPESGRRAMVEGRLREAEGQFRAAREQFSRARQQRGDQLRQHMNQQRQQMDQQRQNMRQRIEELLRQSKEFEHKAAEYERKAEALEDGADKENALVQAEALEAQAEALEAQAEAQEEELEARLEAIEEQMEAEAETIEDDLDTKEEALEAEMETRMQALQAELEALAAANDRAR
jgi:beta-lactamase regulating signal transducer with metallopeptidase domain